MSKKRKKNHRLGTCPCCNGVHRVTKDNRMYQHFQKGWTQPSPTACLGTGRPAKDVLEDGLPKELKGEPVVDALAYPKGSLM